MEFINLRDSRAAFSAASEIGGKALGLARLMDWGLPVPDCAVLPAAAFRRFLTESEIAADLKKILAAVRQGDAAGSSHAAQACQGLILGRAAPNWLAAALGTATRPADAGNWAVRSSALQEDLEGHSFAGQYSSFLNVGGEQALLRAVMACWASLYNPGAIAYCAERGLPLERQEMAVVLQRMLSPEKSGVLFSVDPVSGRDTLMLIESSWGLGESIVKGSVQPDLFRWDWREERIVESRPGHKDRLLRAAASGGVEELAVAGERASQLSLSEAELIELCAMALRAQRTSGLPVDIEWAIEDGQIFLLQCRPETGIRASFVAGEWTTADFKDGGVSSTVCTPLMWGLYDFIWERSMPEYLRSARMIDSTEGLSWGAMHYGRPYWNVGVVKDCLERLPGFVERHFDEDLGIEPAYRGKGRVSRKSLAGLVRGAIVVGALSRLFKEELEGCEAFKTASLARLAELDALDVDAMDEQAFLAFYGKFIREDYFRSEYGYFRLIFNNSNFQSLYRGPLRSAGADILALLSGLRGLSHLGPNIALWDISRSLRADPLSFRHWAEGEAAGIACALRGDEDGPGYAQLRAYLAQYRHHSMRELDILVPRVDQDPLMIAEALKRLVLLDDSHDPRLHEAAQGAAYEREMARLAASMPKRRFRPMAAKIARMRDFLWWREEYRDLSTRFYYFVRAYTIRLGTLLASSGALEKAEDIFFLELSDIFSAVDGSTPGASFKRVIEKRRAYYESYRNFKNPDELGNGRDLLRSPSIASAGSNALRGLACSPGRARGPIRAVADIFAAGAIREGDILFTRFTDPGWTPYFGLLAGVATETGGLLSHAAVISREYGIPAVLAVKGLMTAAADARSAQIDGSLGEILLSRGEDPR